jgi:uncharacterized protein YeaO (DUF488 family)
VTPGTVSETYAAALQHDLADVGDATLVGVVRRPTGWFRALVGENHPELGPPEALLSEVKERHEALAARGLCDEGAHNAAWEEARFTARYREYLSNSAEAERVVADLVERVAAGEDIALVCFEGENKRCHRHLLREHLRERLRAER